MHYQDTWFTGEKKSWRVVLGPSGTVAEIFASVKAWDNEGRKFETEELPLSAAQAAQALLSTQGQQAVINALVYAAYVKGRRSGGT